MSQNYSVVSSQFYALRDRVLYVTGDRVLCDRDSVPSSSLAAESGDCHVCSVWVEAREAVTRLRIDC
jgi:hypothetical protein